MEVIERPPNPFPVPGGIVTIRTERWLLEPWDGEDPPELKKLRGRKPKYAMAGFRSCAELVIVDKLVRNGWGAVWVSAFAGELRTRWFPAEGYRTATAHYLALAVPHSIHGRSPYDFAINLISALHAREVPQRHVRGILLVGYWQRGRTARSFSRIASLDTVHRLRQRRAFTPCGSPPPNGWSVVVVTLRLSSRY